MSALGDDNKMKIAIISLASRLGGTTGDCVQADKTAVALRLLGNNVIRCYLKGDRVLDARGIELGVWQDVLGDRDVIHAIPPVPWIHLKRLPKLSAKLVSSTVFWRSWTYVRVIHKVSGKFSLYALKEYVRVIFAWLHIPLYWSYKGFDLLLPNSEDEIRNFLAYCFVKKGARLVAVPNAIDSIPEFVADLPRPREVPEDDYIVIPAVFASRKNHFALLKALEGADYKVVFMGAGEHLEECKRRGTANMIFLGHVAHGSRLFYGVLKYARVCCLPSNCETPGIAGLEAAALGARPVVPCEGGTSQYYGWDAEYHNPLQSKSIRRALDIAFRRGRLTGPQMSRYRLLTWGEVARRTLEAYG